MKKTNVTCQSYYDQSVIHGTLYEPVKEAHSFVAVFHGMAEHRGRYDEFAKELAEFGSVVLLLDHRGHGDSQLPRGFFAHENGWLINIKDLELLIEQERKQYATLPFILLGHSMGSLAARSYLKRNEKDLDGIIVMGTPFRPKETVLGKQLAQTIINSKGEYYRSELLEREATGHFNDEIENSKTAFDWLSLNQSNVQDYLEDEQCGFPFTATGYLDLMEGLDDVYLPEGWFVYKKDIPILFLSGEDDPVHGGHENFDQIIETTYALGFDNIRYKLYHLLRHEILNELERDLVVLDIKDFIKEVIEAEK